MWVNDRQNEIYTIVKYRANKNLVDSYPNIEFTTNVERGEPTKFPSVYIHFMPSMEQGGDLEQNGINAFLCGVQVHVTVTKEMGEKACETVSWDVLSQFKALSFSVNMMPEFIRTGNADIRQMTFRVRRTIGANNTIGG